MIKQILFLFSFIGLFITRLFVSDTINVTQEMPEKVGAGSEFIVKVNVAKGDARGYANYSLKLPRGLSAELIEPDNGIFSFNDQYVNVFWPELPRQKNLLFTYKVKVSKYFKGKADLSGVFSFINRNKREKIITPNAVVDITANTELVDNGVVICERYAPTSVAPGGTFIVKIKIHKGDITGFARIQEVLPDGFTAEAVETQEAIFSFADQKIKFLWMSLTTDPDYEVSYRVKVADDASGAPKIEGNFVYMVNNETIKQEIMASTITISTDAPSSPEVVAPKETEKSVTEQTTTQTEEQTTTTGEENNQADIDAAKKQEEENARLAQAAEEQNRAEEQKRIQAEIAAKNKAEEEKRIQEKAEAAAQSNREAEEREREKEKEREQQRQEQASREQASASKKSTSSAIISNTPSPSTELNYRVQIAAIRTSVNASEYFAKRYKVHENIFSETHEGWNKYTVGGYSTYRDAKEKRHAVNQDYGIKGPFVTAYNESKRITVQEALMISNQQWIP